ncbi:SulP family inorganic anion transporter [Kribbella sp. NPDC049227]|uniref:SulP family inorganic anion transporter n=1 Tax=Kribbella sp. NPDC049227 TaxID=3364113 RepID=UPI00371DF8A8
MAAVDERPEVKPPWWQEYVPAVGVARSYERAWLPKDIVAGLVLSALLVPQGMAYAELAGLPPVTGLYTSILCLLGYAVFGPSRVLVLGPDSSLGPMIAATIAPLLLANGDPARAVALASMLAVMVGVVMVIAGVARFGFVADLLSKPTQIGYMNGLALTIVIGQLAKLFGFSVDADGLVAETRGFFTGLADGEANATAAVLGTGSLVGILLLNRLMPKLPSVLIVVVLAAVVVSAFDLESHDVDTVGVLPQGFPPFTIPAVSWDDLPPLLVGAFAIAVVALADTMSTASAFAARRGDRVRGNQEMVGIGAANIAAGLFQGFPVSTSGSRTAVAEQAGSRSQVTGIVGAGMITVVLVFATSLMQYVPQPTLGAIVIAAALSLADIAGTRRLWHQRRTEFWLSIIALLGVALLGVLPGILVAVGLSILNVFRRAWWPHETELGRVEGIAGLHDTESYPDAEHLPGLVVYRFDAPLIFANARMFSEKVREIAGDDPDLRWIIVAAEPITDVDTTASDMLQELDAWLNARGVSLVFAELKDPVREKIERYELTRTINPAHFHPTLDEAVAEYMRQTGARWHSPQPEADDGGSRQ